MRPVSLVIDRAKEYNMENRSPKGGFETPV